MYAKSLKCVSCQAEYPLLPLYECKACGGILEVTFEYGNEVVEELKKTRNLSHKTDLLPFEQEHKVSLGEGNTPLIEAGKLTQRLGIKKLFLKCEFCNPTGSFKDRPVSVGIAKAVEFGYRKVVVASSGNGAAAVAAFAAHAGLEALIFVPEATPAEKFRQAAFYGAKVIRVEGPYSNCFALAKEISRGKDKILNLTTTFINPYTVEGDKVVAYELFSQLNGKVPQAIVVPIGAGPLLVGIYKGFEELKHMGVIDELPVMVGVQAEGCSPIAEAFAANKQEVESEDNPQTVAGGISDGLTGYAKDGTHTLNTIRRSGGAAISCDDNKILQAQHWLAEDEGIFVEPSSAASIGGIEKYLAMNKPMEGGSFIALLTGHGLKDMAHAKLSMEVPTASNDLSKVLELVRTSQRAVLKN